MSLNYLEIDTILDELDLDGSFLQEIYQSDFHHIYFRFYKPGMEQQLVVSIKPRALRLHSEERKRRSLSKPPRFTAYLKSHIRGARLLKVKQIANDRIIQFDFTKGDRSWKLYVKLWENNSNLLLCNEEDLILDCFSRRPKRGEIPGQKWQFITSDREPPPCVIRDFSSFASFNKAIAQFYQQEESKNDLILLKHEVQPLIDRKISGLEKRIKRLQKLKGNRDSLRLKLYGDLIMANLWRIQPGDSWLDCSWEEDQYRIQLDNSKDGQQNAQSYYQRFKKKKKQEEQEGVEALQRDLERLKSKKEELLGSESITFLKDWLKKNKEKSRKNQDKEYPGLLFQREGFLIRVGRNAKENDELLRSYTRGNDTWLHCRDIPGGYVFIRGPKGKSIPLEILLDGANLAIKFSKTKEQRADLHYTQVKYLRRAKGGPRGLVIPTQERNLNVELDDQRIDKIYADQEDLDQ